MSTCVPDLIRVNAVSQKEAVRELTENDNRKQNADRKVESSYKTNIRVIWQWPLVSLKYSVGLEQSIGLPTEKHRHRRRPVVPGNELSKSADRCRYSHVLWRRHLTAARESWSIEDAGVVEVMRMMMCRLLLIQTHLVKLRPKNGIIYIS